MQRHPMKYKKTLKLYGLEGFLLSNKIHWHTAILGAISAGIFKLTEIDAAIQTDKPYKMRDEKGMHLLVNLNGSKYFRYNY